ncbi:hypothetical protein KH5_20110 [Urechidicola sp. KH5]
MIACSKKRYGNPTVLVFTKTAGFVHPSIPDGVKAIKKLGAENNFNVETTDNASKFTDDYLSQFSAVVFMSTTGDVLNSSQETAFERYIQAGGGYVGIHAAADTEYDWNWYGRLVGAYFLSHPHNQEADFHIKDKSHGATNFFTENVWRRLDELYNYNKIYDGINVLITIDESTYEGGENGDFHPMAWYHEYDGGRSFYTGLGHTKESFEEPLYLQHLLGGIQYAIGDNLKLDYSKATSKYAPDAERFSKKMLSRGQFFEPTEMTILPNLDVLIAQRRGEIMHYSNNTGELRQVAKLDVYHKTSTPGVNAEEGLMGLQKDPNFEENNWVYLYYSPKGDDWVNRLSRFTFKNGVFDLDSEVNILDVHSQREICCHTGGSIAFGGDGLLYLSTGDNSTPFNEEGAKYVNNGFAPLNDLPGSEQFDARRSSGNSNDLRGKILRIKINDDGSYDIPEGNLFPVETENTRPEIYTMGHRNPYRISVDQKNGYLYWGDVGPDANNDSLQTRGPRGYDEFNQAKKAGNFGWPYFIGDNKPYKDYDYATGVAGDFFDPEKPLNDSRNNTGLRELPPAEPAMVWYPYAASTEFPQVGTGGRNAMAGPAYYTDMYPKAKALPEYYNEKVIIYEWMRGWMKAITLFDNGDFNKMEPFAPNVKLNNMIDLEVASNGQLYMLEYGTGWFQQNEDSGLSILEYNPGNLPPVVENLRSDKESGMLPLTINFEVDASDVESEKLNYHWNLGNGFSIKTNEPKLIYTYETGGDYKVQVSVTDEGGETVQSELVSVVAGNETPEVIININGGNTTFFIPGKAFEYEVVVKDENSSVPVDMSNVYVSVDYLDGMDQVNMNQGHKQVAAEVTGKALTLSLDCRACHKEDGASIGPSYVQISERYKSDDNAASYLADKIKSGGGGVWGETAMSAHPDLTNEDLRQITAYILSLKRNKNQKPSLPASGKIIPEQAAPGKSLVLTASYTDAGEGTVKSLTGTTRKVLASNMIGFGGDVDVDGFQQFEFEGMPLLILPQAKGHFGLKDLDLTDVNSANVIIRWQGDLNIPVALTAHLDSPDGAVIGKGNMLKTGADSGVVPIGLANLPKDGSLHNVYFIYESQAASQVPAAFIFVQFN